MVVRVDANAVFNSCAHSFDLLFSAQVNGCSMENVARHVVGEKGPGTVFRVKPNTSPPALTVIGHKSVSETFTPSVEKTRAFDPLQCAIVDCPGFQDNRGAEINIANAVNIRQVLLEANSIRLVLLLNYEKQLKNRSTGIIRTLRDLLGSQENLIKHLDSILVGVSHAPLGERDVFYRQSAFVEQLYVSVGRPRYLHVHKYSRTQTDSEHVIATGRVEYRPRRPELHQGPAYPRTSPTAPDQNFRIRSRRSRGRLVLPPRHSSRNTRTRGSM